ncbi:MAG: hypothetical protein AAF298_11220 [Cyanobacteria bacterium P01_A01_bin.40]
MRFLSEAEYRQEAKPMLRKVFVDDDPYGAIFVPEVPEKRIIYGRYAEPFPPLMDGIIKGAMELGDKGFYHTAIWLSKTEPVRHCYISFAEYNLPWKEQNEKEWAAIEMFHCLENAVYSPSGKWGCIFAHEHHSLIAGTKEMMNAIQETIPDLDFEKQIHDFITHWQYYNYNGFHTSWILALLTQLCGGEQAQTLLDKYNMKPLRKL